MKTLFFILFATILYGLSANPHADINLTTNTSIECLSCHDGLIAVDRTANIPGSGAYQATTHFQQNAQEYLEFLQDTDLLDTSSNMTLQKGHPVSIKYIEGVASLRAKNTPIEHWSNAKTIDDLLVDGKIECISCHNPQEEKSGVYLRTTNEKSEICLTCHNK